MSSMIDCNEPLCCPTLIPYLRDTDDTELPTLFERYSDNCVEIDYPSTWANPQILTESEVHRVLRYRKLPVTIQHIFLKNSFLSLRVQTCIRSNFIAVETDNKITIQTFKAKCKNIQATLPISKLFMPNHTDIPYFDTFTDSSGMISVIALNAAGKVRYYGNCLSSAHTDLQIPLSTGEGVTTVKLAQPNIAIIGTSTGDIYYLSFQDGYYALATFYKRPSPPGSYLYKFLFNKPIPCMTEECKPNYSSSCGDSSVVSMCIVGYACYVYTTKDISIWGIYDDKVEFVWSKLLEDDILSAMTEVLCIETEFSFEIINVTMKTASDIVILISYTMPAIMKGCCQYAVIKFHVEYYDRDIQILPEQTALIHSYYSPKDTPLLRTPELTDINHIVFVTFYDAIVAVCIRERINYEEMVTLNSSGSSHDSIVATEAMAPERESIEGVLLYTRKKGVLLFQIDVKRLRAVYPKEPIYKDPGHFRESQTFVLQSRMRQSVYFGAREKCLLLFPLYIHDHTDTSAATTALVNDILSGRDSLLPDDGNCQLTVEAKYFFIKRIYEVLVQQKVQMDKELSTQARVHLLQAIEICFIVKILLCSSKTSRDKAMKVIENMVQTQEEDVIFDFVRCINESTFWAFFTELATFEIDDDTDEIILDTIVKAHEFEMKYIPYFQLKLRDIDQLSVRLVNYLVTIFDRNAVLVNGSALSLDSLTISDAAGQEFQYAVLLNRKHTQLIEIAKLALTILKSEYFSKNNQAAKQAYDDIRRRMIDGLCSVGNYEVALELAEQHGDIPAAVVSLQRSDLPSSSIMERNIQYIEQFGADYFQYLLAYLTEQDETVKILKLCDLFPDFADQYFADNLKTTARFSWIYYLHQRKYAEALIALNAYYTAGELSDETRVEVSAWIKMVAIAAAEAQQCTSTQISEIN